MKRIVATGMMILMVGALCACGTTAKQTPVASQTINNELEEYTEDGNKITDLTAEVPVETGGITDQELHYLIDENVRCNYWFACGSLPVDEESSTDGSLRLIIRITLQTMQSLKPMCALFTAKQRQTACYIIIRRKETRSM